MFNSLNIHASSYEVCVNTALIKSSAIWRFKCSGAIKICTRIISNFYMGQSHLHYGP